MEKNLKSIKRIVERNGYEFTVQKKVISGIILDSNIHMNAKNIYEKVRHENIGVSTVYRTLKLYTELGIIKEININGISYYEMKIFSENPLHIHFKCYRCDSIIDIDSKKLNLEYLKLNNMVEKENDIEIYDFNIIFSGLCSKCRRDLSGKANKV